MTGTEIVPMCRAALGGYLQRRAEKSTACEEQLRALSAVIVPRTGRVLATMIDQGNRAVERLSIDSAVASGRSYFVEVAADVFALDLDDDDAEARAYDVYARMIVDGFLPVVVASGRPGHRHLFCRVPVAHRDKLIGSMDVRPSQVRHTIRPPLSPHRHGSLDVSLLLPKDINRALARLGGQALGRPLGAHARWVLERAIVQPGKTVSESVFAVAIGAVNAGWAVEDLLVVLTCPAFGIHRLVQERADREGPERTLRWVVEEVWPAAVEFVGENPPAFQGVASRRTLALLTWAVYRNWPGRSGSSTCAVYVALLKKQIVCGRAEFDVSQRELCELAGVSSRNTVAAALRRLQQQGLIAKVHGDEMGRAAQMRRSPTWRLLDPPDFHAARQDVSVAQALDVVGEDVFRNAVGLGLTAARLYALILSRPGISSEILRETTGLSPRTVTRTLRQLSSCGLVHNGDNGWVVGEVTPEVAAKEIGAAGRLDRQHEQFVRERAARDRYGGTQPEPHPP